MSSTNNKKFRIQNGVDIVGEVVVGGQIVITEEGKLLLPAITDAVNEAVATDLAALQAQVDTILGTSPEHLDTLQEIVALFQSEDGDISTLITNNSTAITQIQQTLASGVATAAQGALADTAAQQADLDAVTAQITNGVASFNQGALADTAVQPGDLGTLAVMDKGTGFTETTVNNYSWATQTYESVSNKMLPAWNELLQNHNDYPESAGNGFQISTPTQQCQTSTTGTFSTLTLSRFASWQFTNGAVSKYYGSFDTPSVESTNNLGNPDGIYQTGAVLIFDSDGNMVDVVWSDTSLTEIPGGYGIATDIKSSEVSPDGSKMVIITAGMTNYQGTGNTKVAFYDLDSTGATKTSQHWLGQSGVGVDGAVCMSNQHLFLGAPLDSSNGHDSGGFSVYDFSGNLIRTNTAGSAKDNFGAQVRFDNDMLIVVASSASNYTDRNYNPYMKVYNSDGSSLLYTHDFPYGGDTEATIHYGPNMAQVYDGHLYVVNNSQNGTNYPTGIWNAVWKINITTGVLDKTLLPIPRTSNTNWGQSMHIDKVSGTLSVVEQGSYNTGEWGTDSFRLIGRSIHFYDTSTGNLIGSSNPSQAMSDGYIINQNQEGTDQANWNQIEWFESNSFNVSIMTNSGLIVFDEIYNANPRWQQVSFSAELRSTTTLNVDQTVIDSAVAGVDLSAYATTAEMNTAIAGVDVTGSDLDMSGNKVLFGNMYSTLADLPSATTYHGMFAHVHATGKGYFAHAGNWVELANTSDLLTQSDIDTAVNTAVANVIDTAPDSLNTLNELAAALGDDANFASTVTTSLASKADDAATTTALATKADDAATTAALASKATTAQGALADTAVQPEDFGTGITTINTSVSDWSQDVISDGIILNRSAEREADFFANDTHFAFHVSGSVEVYPMSDPTNMQFSISVDELSAITMSSDKIAVLNPGDSASGGLKIHSLTDSSLLYSFVPADHGSYQADIEFYGEDKIVVGSGFDLPDYIHLYNIDGTLLNSLNREYIGGNFTISGDKLFCGHKHYDQNRGRVSVVDLTTFSIVLENLTSPSAYTQDEYFGENLIANDQYLLVVRFAQNGGPLNDAPGAIDVFNVSDYSYVSTFENPEPTTLKKLGLKGGGSQRFNGTIAIDGNYGFAMANEFAGGATGKLFVFDVTNGNLVKAIGITGRPIFTALSGSTILNVDDSAIRAIVPTTSSSSSFGVDDSLFATKAYVDSGVAGVDLSGYTDTSGMTAAIAAETAARTAAIAAIPATDLTPYSTTAEMNTAITAEVAATVDAAPAALDTLNELAAALGDDANFASTVTTSLAAKADSTALDAAVADIATNTTALATKADSSAVATTAQGALADTALQPADLSTGLVSSTTTAYDWTVPSMSAHDFNNADFQSVIDAGAVLPNLPANNNKSVHNGSFAVSAFKNALAPSNNASNWGNTSHTKGSFEGLVIVYNDSGDIIDWIPNPESYVQHNTWGNLIALNPSESNNTLVVLKAGAYNQTSELYVYTLDSSGATYQTNFTIDTRSWQSGGYTDARSLAVDDNYIYVGHSYHRTSSTDNSGAVQVFDHNGSLVRSIIKPVDGKNFGDFIFTDPTAGKVYVVESTNSQYATVYEPKLYRFDSGMTTEETTFSLGDAYMWILAGTNAFVNGKYYFANRDGNGTSNTYHSVEEFDVNTGTFTNSYNLPSGLRSKDTKFGAKISLDQNTDTLVVYEEGQDNSSGTYGQSDFRINGRTLHFFNTTDGSYIGEIPHEVQQAAFDDGVIFGGDDAGAAILESNLFGAAVFVDGAIVVTRNQVRGNMLASFKVTASLNTTTNYVVDQSVFATKAYVDSGVAGVDLSGYTDTSGMTAAIAAIPATDLTPYSTTAEMDSSIATAKSEAQSYADQVVAATVDAAPAALDTLNELAAALGDDANFASTVTTSLASKADDAATTTALATKADDAATTAALATKATAAQGALADTAVQPEDFGTGISSANVTETTWDVNSAYQTLPSGPQGGTITTVQTNGTGIFATYEGQSNQGSWGYGVYWKDLSVNQDYFIADTNPYNGSDWAKLGASSALNDDYYVLAGQGKLIVYSTTDGSVVAEKSRVDFSGSDKEFGKSVAINGDKVIVSDHTADSENGAVYVYDISSDQILKIANPNPSVYTKFSGAGYLLDKMDGVSSHGNKVLVGAPFAYGDQFGSGGKVFVFNVNDGSLIHTLDNPNTSDTSVFGLVTTSDDNYYVVGASSTKGSIGQTPSGHSGAIYIYSATDGSYISSIVNPQRGMGSSEDSSYGRGVEISNGTLFVSAERGDTGDGSSDSRAGKVYLYNMLSTPTLIGSIDNPQLNSGDWPLTPKLSDLSGGILVVGDYWANKTYFWNASVTTSPVYTVDDSVFATKAYVDSGVAGVDLSGYTDTSGMTAAIAAETAARTAAIAAIPATDLTPYSTTVQTTAAIAVETSARTAAIAAIPSTDLTPYSTTTEMNSAITTEVANVVDAAPAALDTLNELAAALGDDANFASTVTASIGTKADDVATTAALATKADVTALDDKASQVDLTAETTRATSAETINNQAIAILQNQVSGISTSSGSTDIQMTADVDMDGNKISNLGTPTSGTDAATKAYVDSGVAGVDLSGYTDTLGTTSAISTAQSAAEVTAAADATSKVNAAQAAAGTDATSKADAAQAAAISTASADATTKVDAAQASAISTASADATSKSNAAQASAISTASADATTKADAAQAAAQSYADGVGSAAVASVIDAAPASLDTLNELAAALGDDANFASTVTASLATKADATSTTASIATAKSEAIAGGIDGAKSILIGGICIAYDPVTGTISIDETEVASTLHVASSGDAGSLGSQSPSHYRIDVYDVNGTIVN